MANARWKRRPEGSTWGDFGPDDQLGRLNLLTSEKVREGIAEVREGRTFCLSLPLDYPGGNVLNPRRLPPVLSPTDADDRPRYNFPFSLDNADQTDIVCDDRVLLTLQYSTQWDGLCHVGAMFDADGDGRPEPVYYNGYRAHVDIVGPVDYRTGERKAAGTGARALGVENMAVKCLQGRGVLIDLHAHFGAERRAIGYADLMQVMEQDRVTVESGDMLCLHTGFSQALLDMGRQPDGEKLQSSFAVLDGRDDRLLRWISDSGLVALIADNYAVEALPSRACGPGPHAALPLHQHCLFKLGLNLGELWYLTELAEWLRRHSRHRFLLTAPPLRLPGAVGSPATPVATV